MATKIEVQGCRGNWHCALEEEGGLFIIGHDVQFDGLAPNTTVDITWRQVDEEGQDVVVQEIPSTAGIVDRDADDILLRESSEDEI